MTEFGQKKQGKEIKEKLAKWSHCAWEKWNGLISAYPIFLIWYFNPRANK